ncbi:hypothetical protein ABIC51_002285 [Burkholderia sp. 572]
MTLLLRRGRDLADDRRDALHRIDDLVNRLARAADQHGAFVNPLRRLLDEPLDLLRGDDTRPRDPDRLNCRRWPLRSKTYGTRSLSYRHIPMHRWSMLLPPQRLATHDLASPKRKTP